ncbi:MAG: universal stress protein [Deltaproteobacteria bacterium]|nr:universal stress protein [Deltaproteobacteria bacterium]
MRILFAADENPYSADALLQVARLGENTWADITLLGVSSRSRTMDGKADALIKAYHQKLLGYFDSNTSPYFQVKPGAGGKGGIHKQIITRVRKGNPAKEILEEAKNQESDLIAVACSNKEDYAWEGAGNVPLKVARDAACSVLVIKEDKKINKVLCCLDHDNISQESLEMISQMVTLFKADLEIVVLKDSDDVQERIEKKLSWLINYYSARSIFPCIELVKLSHLETFISQQARWGLMAMWMGKKSILERVFPSNKVSRLLKANESSVLLLR